VIDTSELLGCGLAVVSRLVKWPETFCTWVEFEGFSVYRCDYASYRKVSVGHYNEKIGNIVSFSIPTDTVLFTDGRMIRTCPGATRWCRANCYAKKGRTGMPITMSLYASNLVLYLELGPDSFADMVEEEIKRTQMRYKTEKIVRVHVAGDLFEKDYIEMWRHIAERMPDWRFYTYTRSWRIPGLLPYLEKLRRLPNFVVYASTDPDTGPPPPGWLEACCVDTEYKPGFKPYTRTMRCPGEVAEEKGAVLQCEKCRVCIFGRASVHWEVIR
jgi:hypothetical protein